MAVSSCYTRLLPPKVHTVRRAWAAVKPLQRAEIKVVHPVPLDDRFTPASLMPPLLPSASATCSLHISKGCRNPQVYLPAELRKMLYATMHILKTCCLVIQGGYAGQEAAKKTLETATP